MKVSRSNRAWILWVPPPTPSESQCALLVCNSLDNISHHSLTGWLGLHASPHLLWGDSLPSISTHSHVCALKVALLMQELRARGLGCNPGQERQIWRVRDFQQLCALVQEVHGHW